MRLLSIADIITLSSSSPIGSTDSSSCDTYRLDRRLGLLRDDGLRTGWASFIRFDGTRPLTVEWNGDGENSGPVKWCVWDLDAECGLGVWGLPSWGMLMAGRADVCGKGVLGFVVGSELIGVALDIDTADSDDMACAIPGWTGGVECRSCERVRNKGADSPASPDGRSEAFGVDVGALDVGTPDS